MFALYSYCYYVYSKYVYLVAVEQWTVCDYFYSELFISKLEKK